jgi:hypothetical protein
VPVYGVAMADWDDVRRHALALPVTEERTTGRGLLEWRVQGKSFVFERPLRQADLAVLRGDAPDGRVLGAHVPDLVAKEALVADASGLYFTTPHFDGYAIVLVQLDRIPPDELEELVVDAWFARAPKRVAATFLDQTDRPSS